MRGGYEDCGTIIHQIKILYSAYAKSDLDEVAVNTVQLYVNQHEKFLGILKEFEDLFNRTLVNGTI